MKQVEIALQNISEAREQLQKLERSLLDPEFDEVELKIQLEHAYHHLNYAWNIRNETDDAVAVHSQSDFIKWSKFPVNDILAYE